MLQYWFYPNPGNTEYSSPKVILLMAVCALLIFASFAVGRWRKKHSNPATKKLTTSWPRMMRALGFIGLVLVVCRVEEIQFFAMRFLWVLWILALVAYVIFQAWMWKKRHYTIVKKERLDDPRDKYLPRR